MTSHEAMMVVNDDEEEGSILVRKLRDPPLHSMVFDNTFLLEEIISYINKAPIHLMVLQKTCKHYHSNNILQRAIMSIFRSNLDHLVSRAGYAELSKQTDPEGGYTSVLKPKKCVLSGSIVLQAILGEVWPGSDIDMYTVASDALRVRHKLYRKMGYLSPVRPWGTEPHTDDLGALNVYLIAIPGSVLESVEIWTSPKPKADDVQAAADLLNTARIDGTLRFHKSSRSAGMLQMMVLKDEITTAQEAIDKFDLDIVMNTWDGVTLQIHNYLAIATGIARGSGYIESMAWAFGNVTDPTTDKYFRLKELEEAGLIKIGGMDGWGTREGMVTYKTAIKSIFNVLFGRLYKYSLREFKIMLKGKEWTRGKLKGITEWITDDDGNDTETEGDIANGVY